MFFEKLTNWILKNPKWAPRILIWAPRILIGFFLGLAVFIQGGTILLYLIMSASSIGQGIILTGHISIFLGCFLTMLGEKFIPRPLKNSSFIFWVIWVICAVLGILLLLRLYQCFIPEYFSLMMAVIGACEVAFLRSDQNAKMQQEQLEVELAVAFQEETAKRNIIAHDVDYVQIEFLPGVTAILRQSDEFVSAINTPWEKKKTAQYMPREEFMRENFYKWLMKKVKIQEDEKYIQFQISANETILERKSDGFISAIDTPWDDREATIYKSAYERDLRKP